MRLLESNHYKMIKYRSECGTLVCLIDDQSLISTKNVALRIVNIIIQVLHYVPNAMNFVPNLSHFGS